MAAVGSQPPGFSLGLDFLSTNSFPAQFSDFLIAKEDLEFQRELPTAGAGRAFLVRYKGSDFVLKTVLESRGLAHVCPAYASLISSLLSLRYYFLAPIQGFTAEPPLGICYSFYDGVRPLSAVLASRSLIPATNKALIAAFVAYGMAYLEVNQLVHGALHSGNILVTESLVPIITDYGLCRGYDFFRDPNRCDQIAWIAPEALLFGEVNYSADVYAYGVLLFEIFEGGRRPFEHLSNVEYLIELRAGRLETLDFKLTPPSWRGIIRRCTDRTPLRRPTFLDLYQSFRSGQYVFPGIDVSAFKAVIEQYPIQWITRSPDPPPDLGIESIDGSEILADPKHPQFIEYVQYLGVSIPLDAVDTFANTISGYVGRDQPDQALVRFLLSAVASVAQQGIAFRKELLQSRFFTRLHITNLDQADILLEILLPVFTSLRDLFARPLYESIGLLFVFHPTEALNLFSRYIKDTKTFNQAFWDVVHFYIGLWPLFCNSVQGDCYLRTIVHLFATSREFKKTCTKEVLGIVSRFQNARLTALSAHLFIARFFPSNLSVPARDHLRLARDSEHWPHALSILLRITTLAASPDIARALADRLHESGDSCTWALILRYARTGEAHARFLFTAGGWFDRSSIEMSFRTLLAIFGYPALRPELARRPEFFDTLKTVCRANNLTIVHSICSLLQRVDVTPEYVALASKSGLLEQYIRITLEAADPTIVRFGIVCVDGYARFGYADEWLVALGDVIRLLKTRFHEFGDEVIAVMSTLSIYQPCLEVMREQGLVEYYEELLAYEKYTNYARFFLSNAAR
jgi:serine/threonine protein kinase